MLEIAASKNFLRSAGEPSMICKSEGEKTTQMNSPTINDLEEAALSLNFILRRKSPVETSVAISISPFWPALEYFAFI